MSYVYLLMVDIDKMESRMRYIKTEDEEKGKTQPAREIKSDLGSLFRP